MKNSVGFFGENHELFSPEKVEKVETKWCPTCAFEIVGDYCKRCEGHLGSVSSVNWNRIWLYGNVERAKKTKKAKKTSETSKKLFNLLNGKGE